MINTNAYAQRALQLAEQGYTTIPLTGKRPVTEGWQNLRKVTPEMVADWERAGYYKNIGMVCGCASNNVVVVDFDGMAGYEMFKQAFPELADTFTVATGSGKGMHVYFKVDLLPDSTGFMNIPIEGSEPCNIEIKADGKQVVIPPSIHPDTGKAYVKVIDKPIMRRVDLTAVIAWAKSLTPQEWNPPQGYSNSDTEEKKLNQKLFDAVESYFLSKDHKLRREWINTSCPNHLAHKHGDKVFSFGYHPATGSGHCFQCGNMNLKTILEYIGMNASDYGGFYEKSAYIVQIARNNGTSQNGTKAHDTVQIQQSIPVVTRTSRLTNYWNRVFGEGDKQITPVRFPFPALHEYGGMASVIKPGKLIGIVGISGGGKTTFLESMIDAWLDYGVSSLVWSPEWDGDEFIERAVQRYGGATTEEMLLHEIWLHEQKTGKAMGGKEMARTSQDASVDALRKLRGWESEVGYLDCPFLTIGHLQASIEATLKTISFNPQVLVIDYIQLMLAMEEKSDLTMYNLLMRVKALCRAFNLVGCIATQVTKDSARGQAGGQVLDSLAARYVNDDAFNLFITVNPDREANGKFMDSAVLNVAKNSNGRKGKKRVGVHWDKLLFEKFPHAYQRFPEDEKEDGNE